jgi:gluconolactonase
MKWFVGVIGAWCVFLSAPLLGQSAGTVPPAVETTAPDIPGVVAAGTKVQVLQTWDPALGGEAPISMPDGTLLFSQQDLGRVIKIGSDGAFSTYLETKPNQVLGLAYDLKGRLIAAHRGQPNGLVVLAPERSALAESFDGQPFSSPNDLVIDQKGGVYFTDNVSEKTTKSSQSSSGNKPVEAVYYRTAAGQVLRVTEVPSKPNGIQLSPDGRVLYVDSGPASFVTAFDVESDGRLSHGRNFAQLSEPGTAGGADGMAIDSDGRLYVAANGGIKVFGSDGRPLGTIPTSIKPRNLAFAGADRKTLFIVTRGAAYKVAMLSEGMKGRAK